jgi:glycosyltransferase involved in cell wall biosynthesis
MNLSEGQQTIMYGDPYLSIIVPLYNEEESATSLHEVITESMGATDWSYEIIFVDDGSSDNTFEIVEDLAKSDPNLRIVKFRRNYGQTPAMAAGIQNARGDILITMDGDLQNDPADIPAFVKKINDGYEIVVGWRHRRQDKLLTRKIPSKLANWLIGKVTGVPIKDNGCSLKAYRAEVIKNVPLYSEMHRFIPVMSSITGARIAEIRVRHHARQFGQSKYGLSRIYKVLLDLLAVKTIVTFSSRPMLWFGILSLPAAVFSVVMLVIHFANVLTDPDYSSVIFPGVAILFGALALFAILGGALCELITKTGDPGIHRLSSITASFLTGRNSAGAYTNPNDDVRNG